MAVARYWMGVCLVCAWVLASVPTEAQVSPLNLAPGFPTQLDDAYPLNTGAVALQPAVHFDKTSGNDGRLRQTFDVRWGQGAILNYLSERRSCGDRCCQARWTILVPCGQASCID